MDRVWSYLPVSLPRLRLPSIAKLRDGSFFQQQSEQSVRQRTWLQDFESKLVLIQEVAVWSNPVRSVIWLVLSQMVLYYLLTTSLLSSTAYITLIVYIYITWVYTIWPAVRVSPALDDDEEVWTPIHPDVLSAPELDLYLVDSKKKTVDIVSGLQLLHIEYPGTFCIISSFFFALTAVVGYKFSTPFLLHGTAFLALVLPGLIIRISRHPNVGPMVKFSSDFLSSLGDVLVYRGINAPPRENKDLDDLVPEMNQETESYLNKALSYIRKTETEDQDISLTSGLSIPSHDEVELDSFTSQDLEADLLPITTLAIEHGVENDSSDSEIGNPVDDIREYNDTDSDDSFDLDPKVSRASVSGVFGTVADMVTSSVASSLVSTSSVSQILSSFVSTTDNSHPDMEDFEMISEDELSLEMP